LGLIAFGRGNTADESATTIGNNHSIYIRKIFEFQAPRSIPVLPGITYWMNKQSFYTFKFSCY
jgi:hypothetical protein